MREYPMGEQSEGSLVIPNWVRALVTAAVSVVVTTAALSMHYGSVASTASAADKHANQNEVKIEKDLRPRIRSLEEWRAETRASSKALEQRLDRMNSRLIEISKSLNKIASSLNSSSGD